MAQECEHEWHTVWLRRDYAVCYLCRAIKEKKSGLIVGKSLTQEEIAAARKEGKIK